jgi:hypothetical protein
MGKLQASLGPSFQSALCHAVEARTPLTRTARDHDIWRLPLRRPPMRANFRGQRSEVGTTRSAGASVRRMAALACRGTTSSSLILHPRKPHDEQPAHPWRTASRHVRREQGWRYRRRALMDRVGHFLQDGAQRALSRSDPQAVGGTGRPRTSAPGHSRSGSGVQSKVARTAKRSQPYPSESTHTAPAGRAAYASIALGPASAGVRPSENLCQSKSSRSHLPVVTNLGFAKISRQRVRSPPSSPESSTRYSAADTSNFSTIRSNPMRSIPDADESSITLKGAAPSAEDFFKRLLHATSKLAAELRSRRARIYDAAISRARLAAGGAMSSKTGARAREGD